MRSLETKNLKHDLTGWKFGRLFVVSKIPITRDETEWICACSCGSLKVATTANLLNGKTSHCGCEASANRAMAVVKHGMYGTSIYSTWSSMIKRCYDPRTNSYKNYGGKGISVCREWKRDFSSFHNWAIANGYREGLQIDRKRWSGNYEPRNARWVTPTVNANNRESNHRLTLNGKTMTLAEWGLETGISQYTLSGRIGRGWSVEKALTTPPDQSKAVRKARGSHG